MVVPRDKVWKGMRCGCSGPEAWSSNRNQKRTQKRLVVLVREARTLQEKDLRCRCTAEAYLFGGSCHGVDRVGGEYECL